MQTKELTENLLINIEQFIPETFNEEEMMEIKGGVSRSVQVNNGTGCGCSGAGANK